MSKARLIITAVTVQGLSQAVGGGHHVATSAPLLGWVLAAFSISAALGAVAGGVLAPRIGNVTTTVASLVAAVAAFTVLLVLPAGGGTVIAGRSPGSYCSQVNRCSSWPHRHWRRTLRRPQPGWSWEIGGGLAGLLYIGSGALQGLIGLSPAMQANFLLLIPAALIAARGLRVATDKSR